jgi:hypothetical protein
MMAEEGRAMRSSVLRRGRVVYVSYLRPLLREADEEADEGGRYDDEG